MNAINPSKNLPHYILGSQDRATAETKRLKLLEVLYDPTSRQRLDFVEPGWRCLEVGAGSGSIAAWLGQQVGPDGKVVASDMDTRRLDQAHMPNCQVIQHNILTDPLEALGPASFDLAHCRFLLCHLLGHQEIAIDRMVRCLKPGGWLVIEDFDMQTMLSAAPWHRLSDQFDVMQREVFSAPSRISHIDSIIGRKLPALFDKAGLTEVRHECVGRVARGGSQIADWNMQGFEAGRAAIEEALTSKGYELYRTIFNDPTFYFMEGLSHVAWGRKASPQ